jgi:cytochrome c
LRPRSLSRRLPFRLSPVHGQIRKRGAAVYEKFNCSQCHGDGAEGDGPSADDLTDDWGNPIVPYDLTEGHIKCGDGGPEIYRVFIGGLNGTPMPSFADSISPDEAWDLVHFIQSLSPVYPKNLTGAPNKPSTKARGDETIKRMLSIRGYIYPLRQLRTRCTVPAIDSPVKKAMQVNGNRIRGIVIEFAAGHTC